MDDNCVNGHGCMSPRACDNEDTCLAAQYVKQRKVVYKNPLSLLQLGSIIFDNRPEWATGIYITNGEVRYGRRTNKKKRPDNYFWFDEMGLE